jgi:putative oxidoreductase
MRNDQRNDTPPQRNDQWTCQGECQAERSSRVIGLLDSVPYTLLALPLRAGVATVFWNSAMAKLANWDTTIELFTEEYKVPLLPPEIAANLALSIELATPVLLVLGLLHALARSCSSA